MTATLPLWDNLPSNPTTTVHLLYSIYITLTYNINNVSTSNQRSSCSDYFQIPVFPKPSRWTQVSPHLVHFSKEESLTSRTIFFWAPLAKWGLVAAGLKDFSRPAEKLSVSQNVALAATGFIWVRDTTKHRMREFKRTY
jgi:hypothetical protein